jgi:hypothetical protein
MNNGLLMTDEEFDIFVKDVLATADYDIKHLGYTELLFAKINDKEIHFSKEVAKAYGSMGWIIRYNDDHYYVVMRILQT